MALSAATGAGLASAASAPTGAAAATCHMHEGLPDKHCTPGATNQAVTQTTIGKTICVKGWTQTIRPSSSVTRTIKIEREIAYGIPAPHPKPYGKEELDHLISLELGGAPAAIANLWPEPLDGKDGYKQKDTLENRLKRLVCAHELLLKTAQKAIAGNWVAAYRKYMGKAP
jgi:hypothetical protein